MNLGLIKEKEQELLMMEQKIENLKREIEMLKRPKEKSEEILLSSEEKIKIFASLFKGRDDVFAYRWESNKTGRSGYSFACSNAGKLGCNKFTKGNKCSNCKDLIYMPLDLNICEKHLRGKTIGVYPLTEDECCYFLAFDFDKENYQKDVLSFAKVCDNYNIPIHIEKSRSGNGAHLWIFFENKIKAITARKLGSLLLSKTMETNDNMTVDSFDRMFPNQDFMPKGGLGNLIALPHQRDKKGYGNTVFVDKYFIPITNQWDYMNNIKKINSFAVQEFISQISSETIDVSHEDLNIKEEVKIKSKNRFNYPKTVKVIIDDMVYIDKENLSGSVKHSFRRLASFANPEFYKKQRMRMSVHNIPMVIDCSKVDDKYIKIPRGTYEFFQELCKVNNVKIILNDKRNKGNKINLKFNGILREEQKQALNELIKYNNGILEAPTGFGKTVIATSLISSLNVNTLIIVDKLALLRQWQSALKKFLDLEDVGMIKSGKNTITNVIDVASIKSLWNNGEINEIVKNYGLVIMDECHHASAFTYENALNEVNAKYVYGLSATPDKDNGHTPIIKMQCGEIRYKVDFKEFNKNLGIPMKVIIKENELKFINPIIKDYGINEINDLIAKDIIRVDKVLKDVIKVYEQGKNILVLTKRLDHLELLQEKLSKVTGNLFVYRGGIGKKILNKYEIKNNEIKDKSENKIILATGSTIGEGFDDDSLEVLFLTMPISSPTNVIQYAGRLHRKNENKKEIIIYDYVDINFKETRNMLDRRKKIYLKMGYEIIE